MTTDDQLDKRHQALHKIGEAVDGLKYSEALGVLASFASIVLDELPSEVRVNAARGFYEAIREPTQPRIIIQ